MPSPICTPSQWGRRSIIHRSLPRAWRKAAGVPATIGHRVLELGDLCGSRRVLGDARLMPVNASTRVGPAPTRAGTLSGWKPSPGQAGLDFHLCRQFRRHVAGCFGNRAAQFRRALLPRRTPVRDSGTAREDHTGCRDGGRHNGLIERRHAQPFGARVHEGPGRSG